MQFSVSNNDSFSRVEKAIKVRARNRKLASSGLIAMLLFGSLTLYSSMVGGGASFNTSDYVFQQRDSSDSVIISYVFNE